MSVERGRLSLWTPVIVYMALIFLASSIHRPPALPVEGSDKIVHIGMYWVLAGLLVRAKSGGFGRPVVLRTAVLAVLLSIAYGATDEIHQHFVPPRQMDALDLVADGIGATLAATLLYAGIIRGRDGL